MCTEERNRYEKPFESHKITGKYARVTGGEKSNSPLNVNVTADARLLPELMKQLAITREY
jgi:hypothetical protein